MNADKLIIGMPAGSLADPNRGGNLIALLKHAGFPAKGYEQGGPTHFPLTGMLMGWDGRPQEFGSQLGLGEVDIAIAGDDWIRERVLEMRFEYQQDIRLEKILSLGRGAVRIIIMHNPIEDGASFDDWLRDLLQARPLVAMVSEMPYLSAEWFLNKVEQLGFSETHGHFSVQKFKTPPKIDRGLIIYETWGKTEAKVRNGSVDFGMEITQSGSAIRNYGLVIAEDVMQSETGIWANPRIKENPAKYELARMFLLNLYGSIFAENKVLLFFNAHQEQVPAILGYLREHHLFGDEPTMNEGPNYTEFSIQLDAQSKTLPLARVRYELATLGASYIETVPLESCIPGLDAVQF